MSVLADVERSKRQLWATPGGSHDRLVRILQVILPSLVGAQFESQWTTIDFTQSPCPLFPGLALSDRRLVTIGQ